jgi:predicted metal-dependent HD superfamily phosphohydrolase
LEDCFEYWLKLFPEKNEIIVKWFDILRDNYCQKWRIYHSISYIAELLKLADEININDKILNLAIWFRKAIYVPTQSTNIEVYNYKKRDVLTYY